MPILAGLAAVERGLTYTRGHMVQCPTCGEDNPERARFCLNCGSALVATQSPTDVRKTVTILFADVVGSTSLRAWSGAQR